MKFLLNKFTFFSVLLFLTGCMSVGDTKVPLQAQAMAGQVFNYTLGSGDLLKITIFDQENMSGEYMVNGNGDVSLPLIGSIRVKGLTLFQVEESIKNKLQPDYLLNPRISLQVMNFRPFYILGEVADPKSYPYVDGMTYLNAVAIAGGYTYRAKKGYVFVVRGNDSERNEIKLGTDQKVMPGDTIRVDERFF
ncbi:MAG: polysaccharide biosynthesis/export family protein [Methylococcales bacterium]